MWRWKPTFADAYPEYVGLMYLKRSCSRVASASGRPKFFVYRPKEFQALLPDVRRPNPIARCHLPFSPDEVFESYMRDLFRAAKRYVVIYSTDTVQPRDQSLHVIIALLLAGLRPNGRMAHGQSVENPLPLDE
jgi:hypothetical protein